MKRSLAVLLICLLFPFVIVIGIIFLANHDVTVAAKEQFPHSSTVAVAMIGMRLDAAHWVEFTYSVRITAVTDLVARLSATAAGSTEPLTRSATAPHLRQLWGTWQARPLRAVDVAQRAS